MKYISVFLFVLVTGCSGTKYIQTNFTLNKSQFCTVGSSMIEVERGRMFKKSERKETSYLQKLVYGGVAGNTLRVLYREYVNDMARPAFYEEFRYDITKSKTISYQDYRILIDSACVDGIYYRVIDIPSGIRYDLSNEEKIRTAEAQQVKDDLQKAIDRQRVEDSRR